MTTPTNGIADASVNNDVGASGVAVPASAPAPPKKTAAPVDATSESHQAASPAPSTPKNPSTPRKPRGPTKAQQLATTYQYPLPLRTFPLPPLIPHNPLSILHLLYTYISQVLSPPTSHVAVYTGTFSLSLRAVHITDPTHIRALWEQGFYGKGSLSRSELSWLDREKRRIGEGASKTSEEVTRQRREERQQIKWKRARLQREMVEAKRREEEMARDGGEGADVVVDEVVDAVVGHTKPILGEAVKGVAPTGPLELLAMPNSKAEVGGEGTTPAQSDASAPSPSDVDVSASTTPPAESSTSIVNTASSPTAKNVTFSPTTEQQTNPSTATEDAEELSLVIHDKEHLQLTTEEAFFLHYGLGVLSIYPSSSSSPSPSPSTTRPIPTQQLLAQFRSSSYFPVLADSSEEAQQAVLRPDDNFMINYTVYHHFRSLGWVVRGGVKFGVDYLLYNRGPVFSHAEFAVIILPSYSDEYWASDETDGGYEKFGGRRKYVQRKERERGKWSWMHAVNRVNAQVKKTVVLVYVDVPAPLDGEEEKKMGVDQILARYKVREIVLKRWVSNRSRD